MTANAEAFHREAWECIAAAAGEDRQAVYGIYASRTLAVVHPEVYLRGDAWFAEGARQLNGFRECYDEPTALGWCHMEYGGEFFRKPEGYRGIANGRPLRLDDISLAEYRVVGADHIAPDPRFPFIDQRLGPLPVILKTEGKVVTSLELAEIAYFRSKENDADGDALFLIWCENGDGYLMKDGRLWDPQNGRSVESLSSSAILVFNERAVWYPMMGRDDRPQDPPLADAVASLGDGTGAVSLDEAEKALVEHLRRVTGLDGDSQRRMAAIAGVRAGGWQFHPYFDAWKDLAPESDFEIDISRRLCIVREFDVWANRIAPATAYLAGIAGVGTTEEKMRRLSREYLIRTGVVREAEARGWKPAWRLESWGHLWPCGLMEHTIDDAFRSRTGHCVSQSHMVAAVLEALDVPHIVVNFDRGGVTSEVNHHFVLSRDGTFLFDDGIVNYRGIDPQTEDYGPLLSFSAEGEWARTVGDGLYASIPSSRIAEWIEVIDRALSERFELRFYHSKGENEIVGKGEFLALLKEQEAELVGIP